MTIKELDKLYIASSDKHTRTIMVFDTTTNAERWIRYKNEERWIGDFVILATIHSDVKAEAYLSEEFCNRKVTNIYAAFPDVLVVIIESTIS